MIEEKFVDLYAANSRVSASIARQEIVLTYVLALLRQRGLLDRLAFKGGTCLRKIIFGKQYRFSQDLDFTGLEKEDSETVMKTIRRVFSMPFHAIAFQEVEGSARLTGGGASMGVQYQYETQTATGTFDLEISYRARPILPVSPRTLQPQSYFNQLEIEIPDVQTLTLEEIVSEKLRATFQRTRPRDVYDLYFCFQKPLDLPTVRVLALVKCWEVRDPFDLVKFVSNLQSTKYHWGELDYLLPKGGRPDPKKMIAMVMSKVKMFADLTNEEEEIVDDSKRHKKRSLVDKLIAPLLAAKERKSKFRG
jgi:predicted nucleotidyltransferase component of viral defense system